jgi:hypothetical protein
MASGQKWAKDTTAIESFADKFVLKLNIDTQTDDYTFTDATDGSMLDLRANNNYRLALSLDFQFIGISLGFSPSFLNNNTNNELKGESSFTDIRFRAALGQWIQGFQYSSIKGYYLENTRDFISDWIEGTDPYLQFPNLKYKIFGMSTSYNFNPNFSFRNVLYNTEWQKKSAGSFLPTLYYSYDRFSNNDAGVKSSEDVFPIRLAIPYYYTLVLGKNWYISPNLSPSVGVRISTFKLQSEELRIRENNTYFTKSLEGGLQAGYASKKIIFGAKINFDINWSNDERNTFQENNKIFAQVFFGYRLNAPSFVTKTYDKFAKKLGI